MTRDLAVNRVLTDSWRIGSLVGIAAVGLGGEKVGLDHET
jgi:hypothetical protein